MYKKAADVIIQLPPEHEGELLPEIRKSFLQSEKTVIVFDDDPTGTQTCHDVTVLTSWSFELIAEELARKPSILFILTNSRSLPEPDAVRLTLEIGNNVNVAVRQTGREIVPISRSDSTLRGHFPAEVFALAEALEMRDAVWVLLPVFIEGGRFTINDVHYIVEQEDLVPVADTPFAKDKSFGYSHSNVREWVEEKTKGTIKASDVTSLSLNDIRSKGSQYIAEKLLECKPRDIVLVNAVSYRDLEVITIALQLAERRGQRFLFRSSATFVSILAGIAPGKMFTPLGSDFQSKNGSLIVVGSYVPKTTGQLDYLLEQKKHESIEINVDSVLSDQHFAKNASAISGKVDQLLREGKDAVVYTSRSLAVGADASESLKINSAVSNYLVAVLQQLNVRPSFIITKGGITSSDLASKGLSSKKAYILGQAIPGVPVWRLDSDSKFSKILYIVFPGNVGGTSALWEVWYRFKYNADIRPPN
jgi:uncharacterized protein YgbK (DUF1537 family)